VVLVALVLLPPVPRSLAADLPDPMDRGLSGKARLEALIERIKVEQNAMKTLTARFVQRRESDLLVEPEESRGVFYYRAPDHVRWEYLSPNPISIIIDGKEMTTWYRDLGRADRLKISRYSSQVFKYLGASGSMETLVDYFRVTVRFPEKPGEAYRLRLLPKYDRISEKLDSMTLWVDPVHFIPSRLHYVTADGDVTEYEFQDLQVNRDIPSERFSLELPAGVEVREIDLGAEAD
jgi:outer membrane lipoprotein carrier protein